MQFINKFNFQKDFIGLVTYFWTPLNISYFLFTFVNFFKNLLHSIQNCDTTA